MRDSCGRTHRLPVPAGDRAGDPPVRLPAVVPTAGLVVIAAVAVLLTPLAAAAGVPPGGGPVARPPAAASAPPPELLPTPPLPPVELSAPGEGPTGGEEAPQPKELPDPGTPEPDPPGPDVTALLAAAGGLALSVVAFVLGRRTARPRHERPGGDGSAPAGLTPDGSAPAVPVEQTLVSGLISVHDLAGEEAVQASVEQTLRSVGVHPVVSASGDLLDVDVHEVVGSRSSPVPDVDGRIDQVVRPGWRQRDALLRPAQVRVFRAGRPEEQ